MASISTTVVRNKAPRYRGVTNTPDLNNTGIISGNRMNVGDYIMYSGVSGQWQTNRMYQWNGKEWELLSIEENRWKYLDGINDLTSGAMEGVFSNAFIQTLVTKTAIIENLFSKIITLNNNGLIKSENYVEGTSGFLLPANGKAVFNDEVFIYNLKVVSFEIIPPTSSGTLIVEMIGYKTKDIILGIGWYKVEMAGGGGGHGASGTSPATGGNGGSGGYLSHLFYNHYNNITARLVSGNEGGSGNRIQYYNDYVGQGGNGGVGGGNGRTGNGADGAAGGTSVNGVIVPNTGGGNNANGGAGYIRLYKLS
jgi:hypothetical protein